VTTTFKIKDLKSSYEVIPRMLCEWYDAGSAGGWVRNRRPAAGSFCEHTRSWSDELWRSAALTASMHGVSELCHRILEEESDSRDSSYFLGRIARETSLNRKRLELQKKEALQSITALNRKGITGVFIKGFISAHSLYPEPCLRPMADVDLVVGPPDFEQALEVMIAEGYVIIQRGILEASLCPSDNYQYPHTWSDHYENCRSIDLHCGLRSYPLGVPTVFDESYLGDCVTYDIEDDRVTGLSVHDAAAVMALEIASDMFMQTLRLIKIMDLVLLLEKAGEAEEMSDVLSRRGENVLYYLYPAFAVADRVLPNGPAGKFARHFSGLANSTMKTWMAGIDHFELSQASSHVRKPSVSLRMRMAANALDRSAILKRRVLPPTTWSSRKPFGTGERRWKEHSIGLLKRFPALLKRDPRRTELEVPGFK